MRVLALNPFHGGSHRAFIEGWRRHSRHEFTLLTLPDRHWKWRMRQAAIHFAGKLNQLEYSQQHWDVLWATDMLNLAEFLGLCKGRIRQLPAVLYFHENQLTYPSRGTDGERQRDLHFGVTNVVSALAADSVWWNSAFHRDEFLAALDRLDQQMPDRTLSSASDLIRQKSCVCPPGIEPFPESNEVTRGQSPHILWAARWEHDKQPEMFFDAIDQLDAAGVPFELSVIGQSYREVPACFARARERHRDRVRHWGFLESREAYREVLQSADIYISTAAHEFFGIATGEAIAAGCYPLLPNRLAYPELVEQQAGYLYEDDQALSERLHELVTMHHEHGHLVKDAEPARQSVSRFHWNAVASRMDAVVQEMV